MVIKGKEVIIYDNKLYRVYRPALCRKYKLQIKKWFGWSTLKKFDTLEDAEKYINKLGYEIVRNGKSK